MKKVFKESDPLTNTFTLESLENLSDEIPRGMVVIHRIRLTTPPYLFIPKSLFSFIMHVEV